MRIKQSYFPVIFFILLLFCGSIFARNSGALLLDLQENKLKERLLLNPQQVDSVKEMIKMLNAQANLDRQNFKQNAHALVAAALRRAQMAEMRLFNDLNDSQKTKLTALKEEQKKDREFFSLKEGLLLTVEQAAKVKTILHLYASKRLERGNAYDNRGDLYDPMGYGYGYGSGYGYGPGYGMSGGMQGNMPGTMPGTMQRNMPGTMQGDMPINRRPNPMRMNEDLIERLRTHEAEKEKAIEKTLTPEQKILFNQLKEARHKEFEMILEKIRENRASQ